MRRGEWDDFSDDDLRRTFVKYGEIDEKMSYMIRDGQTQQHKGYGFVAFKTAGHRAAWKWRLQTRLSLRCCDGFCCGCWPRASRESRVTHTLTHGVLSCQLPPTLRSLR